MYVFMNEHASAHTHVCVCTETLASNCVCPHSFYFLFSLFFIINNIIKIIFKRSYTLLLLFFHFTHFSMANNLIFFLFLHSVPFCLFILSTSADKLVITDNSARDGSFLLIGNTSIATCCYASVYTGIFK